MRKFTAKHIFKVDKLLHKLGQTGPICDIADATLGIRPPKNSGKFVKWFYTWFWKGTCGGCLGKKTSSYLGTSMSCNRCNGTGQEDMSLI
jgi:hypothetical protein